MKALSIAAACLASMCAAGANASDEFRLRVVLAVGEQSKDSSSRTETITVYGNSLQWEQTYGGAGRGRKSAVPTEKSFILNPEERKNLLKIVKEGGLTVTETIELPRRPPLTYFQLRLETAIGHEEGAVEISGPRSAVEIREQALYRASLVLVKELYRIMHAQDKSIVFDEPAQKRP